MIINKEKQAVPATNAKNRNRMIKIGTPLLLKLTNKPYHIIQDVFHDLQNQNMKFKKNGGENLLRGFGQLTFPPDPPPPCLDNVQSLATFFLLRP